MEEISPLFAIQAEKALKMNNPVLAIEICKRGLQYFPDYQIGYVLMAEAYEMLGEKDHRDKLVEQIHQQFPKARTTKVLDEKIKSAGSLLLNNEEVTESGINTQDVEEISDNLEIDEMINNVDNSEISVNDVDTISPEMDELSNIDELIDQAQSVIEDIEETIEDLEDEITIVEGELENQIVAASKNDIEDELIINEYAELESEIADLQDYAQNSENPETIVEFSNELLDMQKEHTPFDSDTTSVQIIDEQNINLTDINILEGIYFLPFKFDYSEILELSKNISVENFLNNENNENTQIESKVITKIPENYENEIFQENQNNEPDNEAEVEYEENTIEHFPDDFVPTETLAMIYEKQGMYVNAIDIYQKLMQIHPEKMEHYLNKIMLLETDGN